MIIRFLSISAMVLAASQCMAWDYREYGVPKDDYYGATPRFGATSRLADCQATVTGDGVSDGVSTFYFPAVSPEGQPVILTATSGGPAQPPTVLARTPLPPEYRQDLPTILGWSAGRLVVANGQLVFHAAATPVPTADFQTVPGDGTVVRSIAWRGRLLRLTESGLSWYNLAGENFVPGGSMVVEGVAMAAVPNVNAIAILTTHQELRMLQWSGSADVLNEYAVLAGVAGDSLVTTQNSLVIGHQVFRVYAPPGLPQRHDLILGTTWAGNLGLVSLTDSTSTDREFQYRPEDVITVAARMPFSDPGIGAGMPRVAYGTRGPLLVASRVDAFGRQPLWQLSPLPLPSANYLDGIVITMPPGEKASGLRCWSSNPGITQFAVYSAPAAEGSGPATKLWESGPISGRLDLVPFPREFDPGADSLAVVAWSDAPSWYQSDFSSANIRGFRLVSPGGAFPQSFDWEERLERSGTVSMALVCENLPHLDSLKVESASPTVPGWTNTLDLVVSAPGDYASLQISEAPVTNPVSSYDTVGDQATFRLADKPDGPRTVYVRAIGRVRETEVLQATITLDRTPPPAPAAPTDEGERIVGKTTTIRWIGVEEPSSGVGVARYRYGWGSGGSVTLLGSVPATAGTVEYEQQVALQSGGRYFFSVSAVDHLGNVGKWSQPSDGLTVVIDEAPVLTGIVPEYQVRNSGLFQASINGRSPNPAILQWSLDPAFSDPVLLEWSSAQTWYGQSDLQDGEYPFYFRLTSAFGVSNTVTARVLVERVGPVMAPPVAESTYAPNGVVDVLWRLPVDPEPGSGHRSIEGRFLRENSPDAPVHHVYLFDSETDTTATFALDPGEKGGFFRAQGRGVDAAGNAGPWVLSEPFEVNARPLSPSKLDLRCVDAGGESSFDYFRGSGITSAVASRSSDPDGDPLIGFQCRFRRVSPVEPSLVIYDRVPAGVFRHGEHWEVSGWAIDNRGATGFELSERFGIVNGQPSAPVVQILPLAPRPHEPLTLDIMVASQDADGDTVRRIIEWERSVNGGQYWEPQRDLRDQMEVDGGRVFEGDLWRVSVWGREVGSDYSYSTKATHQVRVTNSNNAPTIVPGQSSLTPLAKFRADLNAAWVASDLGGQRLTVDLYITDRYYLRQLIVRGLDGAVTTYRANIELPAGGPLYLCVVATDLEGASTQIIDPNPLEAVPMTAGGWMLQ